jgi:hypothetical protein
MRCALPWRLSRARETFKVDIDLGEPVALDYFDRQPYALRGQGIGRQRANEVRMTNHKQPAKES